MRHPTPAALALLLALAAPRSAPAQEASGGAHRGVWLGGGLGAGVDDDGNGGGGGYFRIGGTPSPHILLGGEAIGFVREENDVTVSLGNATFVALLYPSGRGLFAKGGVGFATAAVSVTEGDVTVSATESGFGSTIGLGYDIRIGGNLYLTPNADMLLDVIDGDAALVWLFTLGIGMH